MGENFNFNISYIFAILYNLNAYYRLYIAYIWTISQYLSTFVTGYFITFAQIYIWVTTFYLYETNIFWSDSICTLFTRGKLPSSAKNALKLQCLQQGIWAIIKPHK